MKYLLFLALLTFWGCTDDSVSVPKPHAYPKVVYPKKELTHFAQANCPYEFDYPAYAKMIKNTDFMGILWIICGGVGNRTPVRKQPTIGIYVRSRAD